MRKEVLFTESCQLHPTGLHPEDAGGGLGSGMGPHPRERGQDPALGTVLQQSSAVPRYSVPPDMLLRVAFGQWSSGWVACSPLKENTGLESCALPSRISSHQASP